MPFLSRGRTIPLVVTGLLVVAFFYLVPTMAAGNYRQAAIVGAYGFMALAAFLVLRDWRLGVISFTVWIIFEDLIRKSIGGALIVYFVKDVLIVITYFSYIVSGWLGRRDKFKNPVAIPLLFCLGWALVECLNPNLTSYWTPIVGLRMTFFYMPMIYLGYSYVDSEKRLRNFGFLLLTAGLIVSLGGIAQSIWGLTILNPEKPSEVFDLNAVRWSPVSGLEVSRISSVFVDGGRYSQYLFLLFFVGLGLVGLLYALKKKQGGTLGRAWVWVCWLCILYGLVISGQKATILWLLLTPVALLLDAGITHRGLRRHATKIASGPWVRLGLAVVLGLGVAALLFPSRFTAAYHLYVENFDPTGGGGEAYGRPAGYWRDIVKAISIQGHGTGSSSLGLQYIAKIDPRALIHYNVEGGYASVLWEWGVIGLAIWFWWSIRLLWKLWGAAAQVAVTAYHMLAFSIFLYTFFVLITWFYLGMQVYQNYSTQVYLWFFAGVVFKLPQLVRAEAEFVESR